MTAESHRESGKDPFPVRLRKTLGRIRRLPERVLHPLRRRRNRRSLRDGGSPASILFVCHGNICRSPYAERSFREHVRGAISVGSAGFIGPGRASPPEALAVAAERGIDLRPHRSRVLDAEMLGRSDLVIVMEASQASRIRGFFGRRDRQLVLGDLDPERISHRRILDPIGGSEEVFREVYDRIDRCLVELADVLGLGVDPESSSHLEESPPVGRNG